MRVIGALRHYLFSSIKIAFFIFLFLAVFYIIYKLIRKEKVELHFYTWILQYIFTVYLVGVFFMTNGFEIFTNGLPSFFMSPNLIPIFYTIQDILNNPGEMLSQICYNIILFIPFGFLLPCSFPNKQWNVRKILSYSFVAIFLVEGMEFISGRYFDIDDFFINSVGAFIGYVIYKITTKLIKNYSCKQIRLNRVPAGIKKWHINVIYSFFMYEV